MSRDAEDAAVGGDGSLTEIGPAFAASGFFAIRTPLLAFDELVALGDGLARGAAAELTVDRLRAIAARPEVREAIYLASPSLDDSLAVWLDRPEPAVDPKVMRAVFRYVVRMAGRATPFGLFAGVSVGHAGPTTDLRVAAREAARKIVRLDTAYIAALGRAFARHPAVGAQLVPVLSVADDDSLGLLLTALRGRAESAGQTRELTGWIADLDAAARSLAVLAEEPPGSAPGAWRSVAASLADLPERVSHAAIVADVTDSAGTNEHAKVLGRVARVDAGLFEMLTNRLEARAARDRLGQIVQVDLRKPSPAATLGDGVLDEMLRGAELLRAITPARDPLATFAAAFAARYGDEEVPLLQVVDEDRGLPIPPAAARVIREPLLRGLEFAGEVSAMPFGPRESYLLERLQETLHVAEPGARSLELCDDDITRLASGAHPPLPDAFAVLASVAANSDEALAGGRFRVHVARVMGPSGATLLGRFCYGDPNLAEHVARHLRAEEALRPDAIFAEIAFVPEGRDGNVTRRPWLRAHHIALGAALGGGRIDGRIEASDLRLSLVNGRFVLRSHRLGREVLPRLTSAHNYQDLRHPAIYRLLGALQYTGTTGPLAFSWGALDSAPMLPRVTSRRLVLSRARWRLRHARLAALARLGAAARFVAVQRLRDRLGLPRWICVADHDHELPLDLDNPLAVDELVAHGRARDAITIVELFPAPDALIAHGPEGRYVHELVVPFVRRAGESPRQNAEHPRPRAPLRELPRRFPPGSPWLYCKLYAPAASADDLLRTVVRPVLAQTAGAIRGWFFVRYTDPEFHLRLRFHGGSDDSGILAATLLPVLGAATASAFASGVIHRWQIDTYEREVDRYGGPDAIDLAERIFHADSEAVLAWLTDHAPAADEAARWQLALRGIDQLLDDLAVSLVDKARVVTTLRDDLRHRLRADASTLRAIGDRFRAERPALERLLDRSGDNAHDLPPGFAVLDRRSLALRPIIDELRHRERAGRLTRPITEQASSYVHMFVNRMIRAAPVEHELVLYSFLTRLYDARLARIDRA